MTQGPRRGTFVPYEMLVWSAFLVGFWLLQSELRRLLGSDDSVIRVAGTFVVLSLSLGFLVFSYEQPREPGDSFDAGWMMLVTLVIVPAFGWAYIRPGWPEAASGTAATWALFLIVRPRHMLALKRARWLSRQVVMFAFLLLALAGSAVATGVVLLAFWESMELAKSVGLPDWLGIIVLFLVGSCAITPVVATLQARQRRRAEQGEITDSAGN